MFDTSNDLPPTTRRSAIELLNEFPIKAVGDRQVYLKDVAEATDASRIQTALVRINGRPQVYVPYTSVPADASPPRSAPFAASRT